MMMVMSMTGYGMDTLFIDDVAISVEMRSVNSRYLDVITKLPRTLFELEIDIKKIIQSYIQRGRIEVYISISGGTLEERTLTVDWDLLDQYMKQLTLIQSKYKLTDPIPLTAITEMKELFDIVEQKGLDQTIHKKILVTVERAIEKVVETRKMEGAFLQKDIVKRLTNVEQ